MDTEIKPVRLTKLSAGCWVDGSRGHYAAPYMVTLAVDRGYPITEEDQELITAYLAGETFDPEGAVVEIADEAEAWLNEHMAPAGYLFGWSDGDFMLWTARDWQDSPG